MTHEKNNDLEQVTPFKFFLEKLESQSFFLSGIFFILLFHVLYSARDIIIPFVFALIFNFLLTPAVKLLKRLYIPVQVGAALVILLLFGLLSYASYSLTQPATTWLKKGPIVVASMHDRLSILADFISKPSQMLTSINNEISTFTERANLKTVKPVAVRTQNNQWVGAVFTVTERFVFLLGLTILLLYFLLISENFLLFKLMKVFSRFAPKKEIDAVTRQIQLLISKYLFAKTLINIGLGIVVSLTLYLFGMPDAILWGVMIAILEFIPYIGAMIGIIVIFFVSLMTFHSIGYDLLVTLVFFIIVSIEANIITPIVIGKTILLNPLVVFLSLIFWGWLWGIAGAFIAVPLTVIIQLIFQTLYEESVVGELLSE